MKRLVRIACAFLFLVAAPLAAQDNEAWSAVDEMMQGDGYVQALAEALVGGLDAGTNETVRLSLVPGIEFRIVGMCDGDCDDLDLVLFDLNGEEITSDFLVDAAPFLQAEVGAAGSYPLRVDMVNCSVEPCIWSVMAYAPRGALSSPIDAGAPTLAAGGQNRSGDLRNGDQTLNSGEFFDEYFFTVQPGERLVADLTSSDFDTYLIVQSPSGDPSENDDYEGSTNRSRVEVDANESGEWRVMVTTFEAGETGAYDLSVSVGAAGPAPAGQTRNESGSLIDGDETLNSGEFADIYRIQGQVGQTLIADLSSGDFDPYLMVIGPDGEQTDNDDYEGDITRSLVSQPLTEAGEYRVVVTSYQPGESGAYDLMISTGSSSSGGAASRTERGTLSAGDSELSSGEYADAYTFEGRPGEQVTVELESSDFDTYLMVLGPNEFREENDDAGSTSVSRVEAELTELGTYRVIVTTYEPGEVGDYSVSIETGVSAVASTGQRDVETLDFGRTANGQLQAGDGELEGGEYRDIWVFNGTAGQIVTVEMASQGFDSYVGLAGPDGEMLDENDDADGRTDLSRVSVQLRESGRYRVMATSYAAGETGSYSLSLSSSTTTASNDQGRQRTGGGQVYGIFAGISDYGGRASNLAFTAEDAENFAAAMQRGGGMSAENSVVLTDSEATVGNIRAAFESLSGRIGPDDTFVFFYSGHGGRVPRQGGFDRADPDGLDETLSMYDADITDDQMNDLMALVDGGTSVMVLDACFSGGFSKDVISAPGRIGFFSSEEDVTSSVAAKFRAGGYLSLFAADAIGSGLADADQDGAINAIELSQYLHERYREDVQSDRPGMDSSQSGSSYVRTGGPQGGFQHLVVDRGSIRPYQIVFQ
ncbi:MAG: caspase family protein [Gemmatimonadota bacterium]